MKREYIISIAFLSIIQIGLSCKPKNIESEKSKEAKTMTEIVSFDLNVYIPNPDNNFKEKWVNELKKYDLEVEIHPEFDILNQQGFLPFKLTVPENCKFIRSKEYQNRVLLTGFELDISVFDSKEYFSLYEKEEYEELSESYIEKMKKCHLEFFFSVKPSQNTSEYRMSWFAAATLVTLFDGVLVDPQQGKEYFGQAAIEKAIELSDKFENQISKEDWKLHEFDDWQ